VIVSSTDVVETLSKCARIGSGPEEVGSSTFVEAVDVMVGVVSSSTSRVLILKVLLLSRRGIVAGVLIGSGPEEVDGSTFVESVDVMVGVVSSSRSRVLVVNVLLLSWRGTVRCHCLTGPRHLRIVPISRFNTSTVRVHATAQLLFLATIFHQVL
jgi:hypothetical protein